MESSRTEQILCFCVNGLANRIQNIESSVLIARKLGVPLSIIWPTGSDINISFNLIFETPPQTTIHECPGWNGVTQIVKDFNSDLEVNQQFLDAHPLLESEDILREVSHHSRPSIKTARRIYCGDRRQQILKFKTDVEREMESKMHLSLGAVGVHVRRTDHGFATRTSTNAAFFSLVDSLPSDQRIFLCTDDDAVELEFRQRYKNRVLANPKNSRNRVTESGMIEAAIDLALLSKTKFIIGSAGSTFGRCASFWGNIPLHVAHKFD